MALVLNDEQTMLRDNARGFLAKNAPVAHLRALRDNRDADGFSRALWKNFVEMGWAGILVPQDYGGLGLGHVEAGVVAEELGRTLTPSPFLSTAVLAATAIARAGTDKQKETYLPKIVAGDLIATLAVDETAKHHPEKIAMPAARAGNGFKLNGAKTFVIDGHVANLLIVAARTAGKPGDTTGITLFLVDANAPGVRAERTATVDSHNAARITFEDVSVSADNVLGKVDAGWDVLEGVLNVGRAIGGGGDGRRQRGSVQPHGRLPERTQAIRQSDRRIPGACSIAPLIFTANSRSPAQPCSRRCRRSTTLTIAPVRSSR